MSINQSHNGQLHLEHVAKWHKLRLHKKMKWFIMLIHIKNTFHIPFFLIKKKNFIWFKWYKQKDRKNFAMVKHVRLSHPSVGLTVWLTWGPTSMDDSVPTVVHVSTFKINLVNSHYYLQGRKRGKNRNKKA